MVQKRIVLRFPAGLGDQPVVYKLVKDYDLTFNILRARITPKEQGEMVMELKGTKEHYAAGIQYLRNLGVTVEPLSQDVARDDERCTHCGACVTICPTGSLWMDARTRKVVFDPEKCIACELCVRSCPPRAMKITIA
ncbi:MAG: NIL domain-containing protein [Candidatus Omnitrophica bacterium]|nr:NIL domain-containing protein [Candidatus Omnitrophota bacterium]